MRIKICGLFRELDIEYINEARPDYSGFVFAESRRQVSPAFAARLRQRLADGIVPVGVFVNAPIKDIAALYHDGVISIAQLHGGEDKAYIAALKEESGLGSAPIPVIKVIKSEELERGIPQTAGADYYLFDSGAGSGKTFNWDILNQHNFAKPWFLAGGIGPDNITQAMARNPFAVDISSGAETDGVKDREKILQLTAMAKKRK